MMRDFIAIEDLVRLILATVNSEPVGYRIYNAVGANRFSRLSIERARAELDYRPKHDSFNLVPHFRNALASVGGLDPVVHELGNQAEIDLAAGMQTSRTLSPKD